MNKKIFLVLMLINCCGYLKKMQMYINEILFLVVSKAEIIACSIYQL